MAVLRRAAAGVGARAGDLRPAVGGQGSSRGRARYEATVERVLAPRANPTYRARPPMPRRSEALAPLQFLVLVVAGWIQREQAHRLDFLLAENRVLRARLGARRLRLTDRERRLLAEMGRAVGRRLLDGLSSLATPETILRSSPHVPRVPSGDANSLAGGIGDPSEPPIDVGRVQRRELP